MSVLVRYTVLILLAMLMLTGVCLGKQVYLKDGGIIEGQSAWRQGEKVFVKVNRDIVADFNLNEIDLARTFPKAAPARHHRHHTVKAHRAAAPATPSAKTVHAAPATPATSSKPPVRPPPPTSTAAPKPATVPSPTVALPAQKPAVSPAPAASAIATPQPVLPPHTPYFSFGFLFIIVAVSILCVAGQWIVFQKAGHAGWKCLIPFYNMYILMKISGKPGWWMFLLLIPLVGVIFYLFAMLSLAKKFGRSELFGAGLVLLPMIFYPLLAFGGSEYEG